MSEGKRDVSAMTLKQARAQRLLTVRGLAAAAGLAPSTIYQIEHGRARPHFKTIREISAALEMDPLTILEFAQAVEEGGEASKRSTSTSRTP